MTPQQAAVVNEIDCFLKKELKFVPKEHCLFFVFRFCVAREFQIERIKQMLIEYHSYYDQMVSSERFKWSDQNASFKDIKSYLCFGFHNYDKLGRPVMVYKLGQCDFKGLFKKYSVQDVIDFHSSLVHRFLNIMLPIMSDIKKNRVEHVLTIFDFKDCDTLQFMSGKQNEYLKKLITNGQNFYPCISGKQYIINTPMVFNIVWSIVKMFLHPDTLAKIEISSSANKKKLIEEIGEELLFVELGGKSNGSLRDNVGPWKQELDRSYKDKHIYMSDHSCFEQYFMTEKERRDQLEKRICQQLTDNQTNKDKSVMPKSNKSIRDLDIINEKPTICLVRSTSMNVSLMNKWIVSIK